MTESIYWYDLETTGTNPILDRPLQFAGVRTDLDLVEIAPPQNIIGKPGLDVIPQPQALLVTGILMSDVVANGLIEKEFVRSVLNEFETPQTCVTGFNNLRFDDEFTRQMLYRNFHDPYAREWRSGNSRWDVIDLFRAAYALRPDGFNWPVHDSGAPSFRLEDLARANGMDHLDAHDALADVRATIEVTRLLRRAQPRLYDFAFRLRDKKAVLAQLYPLGKQPIVHISSMYPATKGCAAVVLPLCQHPTNNNAVICFDLSASPQGLIDANPAQLARLIFSKNADLDEGEERVALKSVHINKSPIVAPMSTLGEAEATRLGIDLSVCEKHQSELKKSSGLIEKIQDVFGSHRFDAVDDPDHQLYEGGFFSSADRSTMDQITVAAPAEVGGYVGRFQDDRLDEMLFRYEARNWPDQLDPSAMQRWQAFRREKWSDGQTLTEVEAEVAELLPGADEHGRRVLQDLTAYIETLRASLAAPG